MGIIFTLAASAKGSTLSRLTMLDIQLLKRVFFGCKSDGDLTVALFDLTLKNLISLEISEISTCLTLEIFDVVMKLKKMRQRKRLRGK